ncbi:hypothetical protein F5Y10DRAFT_273385 [Nemania abortiva]|nr:hypothetical protein F5Y10DRAFT_273385 [Nemania abortiva]
MGDPGDLRSPNIKYHRFDTLEENACNEKYEDAGEDQKFSCSHTSPCTSIPYYLFMLILVGIAIGLLAIYTIGTPQTRASQTLLTCGSSIDEAKRGGCSFDVLTKTWLPEACPRYYEQEFADFPSTLNMTEWKYWTDLTTTEEITDETMAVFAETKPRGQVSWVSTMRMHLAHCAFGLMRRSAALDAGERVDLATAPLDHTQHCIELLLDAAMRAPGIDAPLAQGKVIFGAC